MDYYDYGPRVSLERPLALVGFMGAGTAHVGHAMASTLGLPLLHVDRHVEHEAGMSLAALQLKRGEPARRRLERDALARAARERPAGVVVLGDGALLDPANRSLARAALSLVYIRRPLDMLHRGVSAELRDAPERYPELVLAGAPAAADELASLLAEHEPGYAEAERTFDAGSMHPQRVSDALIRELSLLPA